MSISSSKAPSNDESQGKEIEGGATGRATGVRRCWITPLVNMVGETELHYAFIIVGVSTDMHITHNLYSSFKPWNGALEGEGFLIVMI